MNFLRAGDKLPVQGDSLPALRFLGGLDNFYDFIIMFSLM